MKKIVSDVRSALEIMKRKPQYEKFRWSDLKRLLPYLRTHWRKAVAGNKWMPEWQFRLGKLLSDRGSDEEAATYLAGAVDIITERGQSPGWLWNANWLLGEALRNTDPVRAVKAYKEFLRLATSENAYRSDAEAALDQLEKKP